MTLYLCDTNVWIALVVEAHQHHVSAQAWLDSVETPASIFFCRDTQRSFLRLLTNQGMMGRYQLSPATNERAWADYDRLLADYRIAYQPNEPPGLESYWRDYSSRSTASPSLWMDAYLAAFARASGYRFVTADEAFRQFSGLDLLLLNDV